MSKKFLFVIVCTLFLLAGIACQPSATPNSNAANKTNGNVNIDPNHLPEGLSASPLPPSSNSTPGIPDPANANKMPTSGTPTPGIPDPKTLGKPLPKGATPTPGIPSPEELRKALNRQVSNSEVQNPNAPRTDVPTSGDSRSRKVGTKKP